MIKWFLFSFISIVSGQVFLKGYCPSVPAFRYFDWDHYLGTWYEQERYFSAHQKVGKCWSATYAKNLSTGNLSLRRSFHDILFKKKKHLLVHLFIEDPIDRPNLVTYTVPGFPFIQERFIVLDTDYDHWSIEYSCRQSKLLGAHQSAWILTRSPNPTRRTINQAKYAMQSLGFSVKHLKRTSKKCYKHY